MLEPKNKKLIEGAINGDESCKNELYEEYKKLIQQITTDYFKKYYTILKKCGYLSYEDLIQHSNLIFTKSIYRYKLNKNIEFSTYLVNAIRNGLTNIIFSNHKLSNDYLVNTDNIEYDDEINSDKRNIIFDNLILTVALEKLDPLEKQLIYDRYYLGLSTEEMKNKHSLSHTTIHKKMNKAIQKMRKSMEAK